MRFVIWDACRAFFLLDSFVVNTLVDDVLVPFMPLAERTDEVLLVHPRDVVHKTQQLPRCIQFRFLCQIMPDGENLVELTQLYGIRPQRLRQAAKSVNDHAINLEAMLLQPLDALHVGGYRLVLDIFAPDDLFSEGVLDDH